MTTRAEHLAWCKQRAKEYVGAGDVDGAWASLASDLRKHPETKASSDLVGLGMMRARTPAAVRYFIDGFN